MKEIGEDIGMDSSIISMLSGPVVVGLMGVFSALVVDIIRRQYERKKEAYYGYLKLDHAQFALAPSQWREEYFFAKTGIELWGNKKVKGIVEDITTNENCAKESYFSERIKSDFLPAIKEDLSKSSWLFRMIFFLIGLMLAGFYITSWYST
jgi:hypothetical protein